MNVCLQIERYVPSFVVTGIIKKKKQSCNSKKKTKEKIKNLTHFCGVVFFSIIIYFFVHWTFIFVKSEYLCSSSSSSNSYISNHAAPSSFGAYFWYLFSLFFVACMSNKRHTVYFIRYHVTQWLHRKAPYKKSNKSFWEGSLEYQVGRVFPFLSALTLFYSHISSLESRVHLHRVPFFLEPRYLEEGVSLSPLFVVSSVSPFLSVLTSWVPLQAPIM